jgi:hypothetical protein
VEASPGPLSTLGVLLTSLITGLAAAWVLKLPLLQGLLVGSIVGSTDAAAVFSVLRSSGLKLPERLTATLEVESGSNDPMAILLTLGLIGVITGTADSPQALLWLFVSQLGMGTLAGLLTGRLATWSINCINLDYPGLYNRLDPPPADQIGRRLEHAVEPAVGVQGGAEICRQGTSRLLPRTASKKGGLWPPSALNRAAASRSPDRVPPAAHL